MNPTSNESDFGGCRVIEAPWTAEQVAQLNRFQTQRWMHPFTCGCGDCHSCEEPQEERVLVATEAGWECPKPGCSYTQNWAWSFMANKAALDRQEQYQSELQKRYNTPTPAATE